MEFRISEVNHDSLDMTDMQKSIRFRREPGVHQTLCPIQMFLLQTGLNLRVLSWFVEFRKEAFLEDTGRDGWRC